MFKTPPIGTVGIFTVNPPFEVDQTKVYKVEGHRSINEYITNNEQPFNLIYAPKNLTVEQYQTDVDEGVIILILVTEEGERLLIPNKYIDEYPNTAIVPHDWIVAAISLGMLPRGYDLQAVRTAIVESVSDFIGVEPTVYFTTKKTSRAVTESEAAALAVIRQTAIQRRETSYAEKQQLLNKIASLEQQVDDLLEMINQP